MGFNKSEQDIMTNILNIYLSLDLFYELLGWECSSGKLLVGSEGKFLIGSGEVEINYYSF